MLRALLLATLFFVSSRAAFGQALSVLHLKVVLVDADRKATPVPRHVLLISDNPTSAPPRQIVTALDGTADVKLRPGNYTVESDKAVVFGGKSYQWTQTLDIKAGRDATLELTADNAAVETATSAGPIEADPSFLLPQWQDSVVALWTPATHASGATRGNAQPTSSFSFPAFRRSAPTRPATTRTGGSRAASCHRPP